MRILAITAGAADMYCGSCLRDNALASALLARGHDVVLMPIYTPTLTDAPNVSQPRVFFGGISVYLQQHVPVFRKTPWLLDRLWDWGPVLRLASRRSIRTDPRMLGELTVSMLRGQEGHQQKELQKLLHWLRGEPPYDLITLPNSLLIGLARPIREALGRPVCCTLQGEDLFLQGLPEPHRGTALDLIRRSVDAVDAFAAVSEYHARSMSDDLHIPPARMRVVPLGVPAGQYAPPAPRTPGRRFTIGYLARIAPEKGLHALCEAYLGLRARGLLGDGDARLEAAGYLAAEHRDYLRGIERTMAAAGLGAEFTYHGAVDIEQKIRFLRRIDVLSVPATYDEPKGLSVLEAMAAGVPVVQPRRGAFPEMIEKTGGGLLVEPDDPEDLGEGLLRIRSDADAAAAMGRRGMEGVGRHYDVSVMADRALEVYQEVLAHVSPG